MNQLICKLKNNGEFESIKSRSSVVEAMFENDKNYGYMKNDGTITFSVENDDQEITVEESEKAFWIGSYEWSLDTKPKYMHIRDYRKIPGNENAKPMIRMIFREEKDDENLDSNTIAYMGYPTNGNTFYGILVLNKRFVFTISGGALSGHEMQKLGIKVQFLDGKYSTMDLDKIIRHELGHGVFGLPHSPNKDKTMSANEGFMAEHNDAEDIRRAQKKAGKSSLPEKWKKIIKKFFGIWTE